MPTVELTKEQLGAILVSLDIRAAKIRKEPRDPNKETNPMADVALASIKDAKAALLSHIQPEAPYLGD